MEKSSWEIVQEKIPNIKIYLLLTTLVFVAYANILPNGFLWDDEQQIVGNQLIQTPGNLWQVITSDTGNSGKSGPNLGFYRPLMNFTYWLNYQIFGLHAWSFHLFQLLLHLANAILSFLVIEEILKRAGINFHLKAAFLIAAIFAVHPGISEAVQYIGAVGEPLFVMFALLSLRSLLSGIDYETRTLETTNAVWSSVFGFFAFTAKESAAGIFAIGLLYLFFFVKPKAKAYFKYLAGGAIATLAYLFMRFVVAGIRYSANHPVPIAKAGFMERILTIPREIVTYFEIFFWPANLQIYRNFVVRTARDINFWLPLGILLALAILFALWLKNRPAAEKKLYSLFFVLYLLFLFPALNIVPLNMTLAERWQYFPAIGLLAMMSIALFSYLERKQPRSDLAALIIFLAIVPTMAIRTAIRDGNWRNGLALFGHDIKYTHGDNANLENNFGVELFRVGKITEAKSHFENSVVLMDDWSVSQNNLGAIHEKEGDLEGARSYYQRAVELSDYYLAYQNMAGILLKLKKEDEARAFLEEALKKFPSNSDFYFQLAAINYKEGNITEAQKRLEETLYFNPQHSGARQMYFSLKSGQDIKLDN